MNLGGIAISNEDPATRFQFELKVGEGSYGAVYKAIDKITGREVAIKVLDLQGDDAQTQDLAKEINILRSCQNKHIVEYVGSYTRDGQLWIAMEYCGAGSVSDLMQICDTTLGELEIAAVMYQSLIGLDYLHKTKKIHRDIKSGNLLLTDDGVLKLADFGVSAELTTTLAKKISLIGTPYFMAPEVLMNTEYDKKADIWSLGVTGFELAVGQPPLADIHPMRAIFQIPNSPPPRLPEELQSSPQFKQFIECCLQKNPDDRLNAADLIKLPFFNDVRGEGKSTAVIKSLLARCSQALEQWRRWEEEEAAAAVAAGSGPEVQGGVEEHDMNGTVVRQDNGVQNSFKTGVRVNGAAGAQQVRDLHDAANPGPSYDGDGTFVVKKAAPAAAASVPDQTPPKSPQADMSTVRELKAVTGGPATKHFGTIKIKPGQNSTMLVQRPVNAQPPAGGVPQLTLTNSRTLVSTIPDKATKADVQRIKSQLEQNRTKDLTDIAAFYNAQMKELDQILAKK